MTNNPTPKQQKLIKILSDNLGKVGSTKTLGQMILEAGYTESMSKNPAMIFQSETIKEGLRDFVSMLDDKRRLAITHLTEKKLEESDARSLAYILDIFTKNHQLLTGGNTEKVAVVEISKEIADKYNLDDPNQSAGDSSA